MSKAPNQFNTIYHKRNPVTGDSSQGLALSSVIKETYWFHFNSWNIWTGIGYRETFDCSNRLIFFFDCGTIRVLFGCFKHPSIGVFGLQWLRHCVLIDHIIRFVSVRCSVLGMCVCVNKWKHISVRTNDSQWYTQSRFESYSAFDICQILLLFFFSFFFFGICVRNNENEDEEWWWNPSGHVSKLIGINRFGFVLAV